jgi:hypothetical protein
MVSIVNVATIVTIGTLGALGNLVSGRVIPCVVCSRRLDRAWDRMCCGAGHVLPCVVTIVPVVASPFRHYRPCRRRWPSVVRTEHAKLVMGALVCDVMCRCSVM